MKLSDLPKDKLKIGLPVRSAQNKHGRITEIDMENIEDWVIGVKWFEEDCYDLDEVTLEVPECCHVCAFEGPELHCSMLNMSFKELFKNEGCPPDICPLKG